MMAIYADFEEFWMPGENSAVYMYIYTGTHKEITQSTTVT